MASALFPTGTVRLLFTDIEGSTVLLQRIGERYRGLLDRRSDLVCEAVAANSGGVFDTAGDSFFCGLRAGAGSRYAVLTPTVC